MFIIYSYCILLAEYSNELYICIQLIVLIFSDDSSFSLPFFTRNIELLIYFIVLSYI